MTHEYKQETKQLLRTMHDSRLEIEGLQRRVITPPPIIMDSMNIYLYQSFTVTIILCHQFRLLDLGYPGVLLV